jgi:hypothetical protein
MKQISFQPIQRVQTVTTPRNQKEDLIEQIVQQCNLTDQEKKTLAKRLALAMNTFHWTEQDLHALLKKKQDATIRNYTGFIKWSANIKFTKV